MNISGSGSLPGGEYQDSISISGSGKVTGNVSCLDFHVSGTGKVEGDLYCNGNAKFSGNGNVKGNMDALEFSVSGNGKIGGLLQCEKCSSSGNLQVGSVSANALHVSGLIKSEGDVTAEDAVIRGAIAAKGLINAEKIDVTFDCNSSANAIGGSFIKIRRKGIVGSLITRLFGKKNAGLFQVAESIDGDVIDVEYVVADSVMGRDVKIGPGCKIRQVVYSETVEVSPDAEVENCDKLL